MKNLSDEIKNELDKLDPNILKENWIEPYSEEEIKTALEVVKQNTYVKNPVGLFRKALKNGWKPCNTVYIKGINVKEKIQKVLGDDPQVHKFVSVYWKDVEKLFLDNPENIDVILKRKFNIYLISKI